MDEIKTRNGEFMKNFAAGDASACAENYLDDAKFMPHGKETVQGKKGFQDFP